MKNYRLIPALICICLSLGGAAVAQEIAPPADATIYILNSLMKAVLSLLAMLVIVGISMRDTGVNRNGPAAYRILTYIGAAALVFLITWISGYGVEHGIATGGFVAPANSWWLWSTGAEIRDPEILSSAIARGAALAPGINFLFNALIATVPVMIMLAAVSGRVRQTSIMVVAFILASFFFPVIRSWVWGGGFLHTYGFVDVGGAALLHVAGGLAGLIGILMIGIAPSLEDQSPAPSPAGAALGSLLLWVGVLAVFAGLSGHAGSVAGISMLGKALANAQIAAAASVLAALVLSTIMLHRADELLVINAAIGGLVAMSADPASAGVFFTVFVGVIAGLIVTLGMLALRDMGAHDRSGVIPAHLFCGIWGILIAALYSDAASIVKQISGLGCIIALIATASFLAWVFVKMTFGFTLPALERTERRWQMRRRVTDRPAPRMKPAKNHRE